MSGKSSVALTEAQRSAERYRHLFNAIDERAYVFAEEESGYRLLDVNDAVCRAGARSREDVLRLGLEGLADAPALARVPAVGAALRASGHTRFEVPGGERDGGPTSLEISAHRLELDGQVLVLAIARDVTGQVVQARERELTVELLRTLNQAPDEDALIREVTGLLHGNSGCEAVGVRLRGDDDYPYYETRGFSAEFVLRERYLCARGVYGEPLRDPSGHAVLECLCGSVLGGRVDPSLPGATASGSFWSNDIAELPADDRPLGVHGVWRGRCAAVGYRSMALIPLRYGEETYGLLQLSDSRPGAFTAEAIALYEGLASSLAVGLAHRRAQEALRQSELKFRQLVESSVDGVAMVDASGTVVVWNEAQAQITGVTAVEALGQPLWDVQYSLSPPSLQVPGLLERLRNSTTSLLGGGSLADGSTSLSEQELQRPDGRRVVVQTTMFPVRSESGYLLGSVSRDITEQRRVQEALRRSEQRYRFLAQNARDVIWTMGLDGRFTYVSPAVEQLRGYSVEEALRQTIDEALTPGSARVVRGILQAPPEAIGGMPPRWELEQPRSDGSAIWTEASLTILRDGQGRPVGLVGISRDISERRQAAEALSQSEERFRSLTEQSLDGVVVSDSQGLVAEWNPALEAITGISRAEAVGHPVWDLQFRMVPAEAQSADRLQYLRRSAMRALHSGAVPAEWAHPVDLHIQRPDGERRVMQSLTFPIVTGQGALLASTNRDVTRQRRAEEALKVSERRFRAYVTAAPLGVFVVDRYGRPVDVNPAACRMTGYSEAELRHLSIADLIAPEHLELARQYAAQLAADGSAEGELRLLRKDATALWGRMVSVQLSTDRVLTFCADATEQVLAEEALRESEEHYRAIVEDQVELVVRYLPDATITFANTAFCRFVGLPPEEVVGTKRWPQEPAEDHDIAWVGPEWFTPERSTRTAEHRVVAKDGRLRWQQWTDRAFFGADGRVAEFQSVGHDVTGLKEAEQALREYERAVEESHDLIAVVDSDYRYVLANRAYCEFMGHPPDQVLGRTLSDVGGKAVFEAQVKGLYDRAFAGEVVERETSGAYQSSVAKRQFHGYLYPVTTGDAGISRVVAVLRDITERVEREQEQALTVEILRLLNQASNTSDLLREVTDRLQSFSGFEAVGIRLKDGDDYPYYETRGFPAHFVEAERYLCERDLDGLLRRDSSGNALLECMCGNVLCSRFDASKPFFTQQGSFWTNSTTHLLSTTTEADRQSRTRNRCNGEGYESVALIPLRSGGETFGLLQLNDRRPGMFTAQSIALFERLADNLAASLGRRQAEAALRRSEEELRSVWEDTPIGVERYDREGRLVDANPACLAIFGVSDVSAVRGFELFDDPNLPDDEKQALRRGTGTRYQATFSFDAVRGLGLYPTSRRGTADLDVLIAPLRSDSNESRGYLVHVQDVTEQRRAEEAIRRNEARLRSLVDILQRPADDVQAFLDYALGEAVKLTDSKLGYIYHYDEDRRQFTLNAWSSEVMAECRVAKSERTYDLDRTGLWGEVVRQRRPIVTNDYSADNPLKKGCPEGHAPLSRFMSVPVFAGEPRRIVAVVGVANKDSDYDDADVLQLTLLMDGVWKVLDRQRAVEALTHSHDLMRYVIEHNRSAVAVFDRDLRYVYVSQRFLQEYGVEEHDVIGRRHYDVFPDLPEKVRLAHRRALAGEILSAEDDPYERADGRVDWTRWECRPWYEADGSIGGVVLYTEVITERKRAEAERAALQAQLLHAQKMESVGRLAGGVAHDFNNLLTAITGYGELVWGALEANPAARQDLEEVLHTAERAGNLTRQLLAFSRKQVLEMQAVDLSEVVGSLGRLVRRLIGEHIEVVLELDQRLLPVYADAAQLEQALVNLCVNARDAMPDGGTLTIATGNAVWPVEAGRNPLLPGECVRLVVRDTGQGMSEAVKVHLFEPFFTTKAPGQGTGLGLATVYGIVKQHGGDVIVESTLGRGTAIAIYLPAMPDSAVAGTDESQPAALTGGNETLLLVEDEEVVRAVARRSLQRLGYRVLEAASGDEALEMVRGLEVLPDLVVTDLVMPHVGGLELVRRLRERHPALRALFVSGYTQETETLSEAIAAGDAYLQKPFTARSLADKVREALAPRPG